MREQSAIEHWLSAIPAGPRLARRLGGRGGNRLRGWIAESQQHAFGFVLAAAIQIGQRSAKGFDAEIVLAAGAFDAVEERGDINQPAARIEEVVIEDLLACHIPPVVYPRGSPLSIA